MDVVFVLGVAREDVIVIHFALCMMIAAMIIIFASFDPYLYSKYEEFIFIQKIRPKGFKIVSCSQLRLYLNI